VPAQDSPQAAGNAARLGIEVRGLRKSFGGKVVLDGVDLEVGEGTVFALLGPNGAGKTTAVRIFSTLLNPDRGEVRIGGFDPARQADEVRSVIGVTGQFSAVDNLLTGAENLMLMADLHHLEPQSARRRVGELLSRFDLADAAGRTAATYSGGMRRRLDLAMTLVGDPRVIFLDEPTSGLDPRSRCTMWQIVRELAGSGTTVLLTTQDLGEADRLANRIAVLDHGRIVAEGSPTQLKSEIGRPTLEIAPQDPTQHDAVAAVLDRFGERTSASPKGVSVLLRGGERDLADVVRALDAEHIAVEHIQLHAPSLDDVFLAKTGRSLEGSGGADSDMGGPDATDAAVEESGVAA
jgi:ABC-2 type transport system ATP-binding protein